MSKLQDIRNLVQEHAVSVSSSPGDWMDYMDTASVIVKIVVSKILIFYWLHIHLGCRTLLRTESSCQ